MLRILFENLIWMLSIVTILGTLILLGKKYWDKSPKYTLRLFKLLIELINRGIKNRKDIFKKANIEKVIGIVWDKLKNGLSNINEEGLKNILCVAFCSSVIRIERLQNVLGMRIYMLYLALVVFSMVYLGVVMIRYLLSEKEVFFRLVGIVSVVWMFFGIGKVLTSNIIDGLMIENGVDFVGILMIIVMFLPWSFALINNFLKSSKNSFYDIVAAIIGFYIFELYVIFLFGIYNLNTNPELQSYIKQDLDVQLIIRIIQYGYMNVVSFPSISSRITYFIQYVIGNLIHVVFLGFVISYASGFLGKEQSTEDGELTETVEIKKHA